MDIQRHTIGHTVFFNKVLIIYLLCVVMLLSFLLSFLLRCNMIPPNFDMFFSTQISTRCDIFCAKLMSSTLSHLYSSISSTSTITNVFVSPVARINKLQSE